MPQFATEQSVDQEAEEGEKHYPEQIGIQIAPSVIQPARCAQIDRLPASPDDKQ